MDTLVHINQINLNCFPQSPIVARTFVLKFKLYLLYILYVLICEKRTIYMQCKFPQGLVRDVQNRNPTPCTLKSR